MTQKVTGACVVLLGLLAVASGITDASSGAAASRSMPEPEHFAVVAEGQSSVTQQQAVNEAMAQAGAADVSHPTVSVGKGSFAAARRTIDPQDVAPEPVDPGLLSQYQQPVYLVVMEGGKFVLHNELALPRGQGVPEGPVLDLVISAYSGAIIGTALPEPSQIRAIRKSPASIAANRDVAVRRIAAHVALDGPPPRSNEKGQISGRASTGIEVIAYRNGKKADVERLEHGRFSMILFAGTYSLVLEKRRRDSCRAHKIVVVKDLARVHVALTCSKW